MLNAVAELGSGKFRVLRVSGVEVEQGMSFAALHRLVLPMLVHADRLPEPQQRALDTTLGQIEGDLPDRFLIGLAVLTLLANASVNKPLLWIVDDAQWIDGESQVMLAFVARRLLAERIVLMLSVRESSEGQDPFEGLPELRLRGLGREDAHRLMTEVVGRSLDMTTIGRLVEEADGNPLALAELGKHAVSNGRTAALLPNEPLPLSQKLEALFERQIKSLPKPTQQFLLIAAAEPSWTDAVWKAAERLQIPLDAPEAARVAGLFDPKRTPSFRHPMVRSAAYSSAAPSERRLVHAMLAELLDPAAVDCRASHLAAAAIEPNEDVASELERAADQADSRGGWSARAAFLARAAELTPEPMRRVDRLLIAASASIVAGNTGKCGSLLQMADTLPMSVRQRAEATRIRAELRMMEPGRAPAALLEAAAGLESSDPRLARETYREALQACIVSGHADTGETAGHVGRSALTAAGRLQSVTDECDELLEGFALRFSRGYEEAAPVLKRGLHLLLEESTSSKRATRWSVLGANCAADLWDADTYQLLAARLEKSDRESGALNSLPYTLGLIGYTRMWAGDFVGAELALAEATEISSAIHGVRGVSYGFRAELLAWQGRDEEARASGRVLTSINTEFGDVPGAYLLDDSQCGTRSL